MNTHSLRVATALALGTAFISGFSVFLAKFAVSVVPDPVGYTLLKNVIAALSLCGIALLYGKRGELAALTRAQTLKLLAIGAVGGSLPFALFFWGLTQTSALNAALIHKTLFIWVALLAFVFLRERLTRLQWLGAFAILAANVLIGAFSGFRWNVGEAAILGATLLWAVENIIAKFVLREVSALTVGAARMVLGSLLLAVIAGASGHLPNLSGVGSMGWAWAMLAGVMLTGYVVTWYAALKRAPAAYVAVLLTPAAVITNALSSIFITHTVSVRDLAGVGLTALGVALVVMFGRRVAEERRLVTEETTIA